MDARGHLLAASMLALSMSAYGSAAANECGAAWSAQGLMLAEGPVAAPNGKVRVLPEFDTNTLTFSAASGTTQPVDAWANPHITEAAWSPDSRRVAITASDGGWVGTWSATIYVVDTHGKLRAEPIRLASSALPPLGKRIDDEDAPGYTNIAFVAWLDGSRRVLIVEEVPPHSYYANLGALRGHIYDTAARKVLEVLDEAQLRRRYGERLGCRLQPQAGHEN